MVSVPPEGLHGMKDSQFLFLHKTKYLKASNMEWQFENQLFKHLTVD